MVCRINLKKKCSNFLIAVCDAPSNIFSLSDRIISLDFVQREDWPINREVFHPSSIVFELQILLFRVIQKLFKVISLGIYLQSNQYSFV